MGYTTETKQSIIGRKKDIKDIERVDEVVGVGIFVADSALLLGVDDRVGVY